MAKNKKNYEFRFFVTDCVSVPVMRMARKGEAYKMAVGAGWGAVDWYSAINNYELPVNRDMTDTTQVLRCHEDYSAALYPCHLKRGRGVEYSIVAYDNVNFREVPRQAETDTIIVSDPCGFSFWAKSDEDIKIFVIYDENGLIDTYRLEGWNGKPYDGETEIAFEDLQSEEDHNNIPRASIKGTFEYDRANS